MSHHIIFLFERLPRLASPRDRVIEVELFATQTSPYLESLLRRTLNLDLDC